MVKRSKSSKKGKNNKKRTQKGGFLSMFFGEKGGDPDARKSTSGATGRTT